MNIFFLLMALVGGNLKVGVCLPLTGSLSNYGRDCLMGIKMALDEVEGIDIIVEDNLGEESACIKALEKLANKGCEIIIGPLISNNVVAVTPTLNKLKIPLFAPCATNVEITKGSRYIWRLCYTDEYQGQVMATFAYNMYDKRRAAIIYEKGNIYSEGLAQYFKKEFTKEGGVVVAQVGYFEDDKHFEDLLKKVQEKDPDCIFVPGYYEEVGLIINQARRLGITCPFMGCDGWDSPRLVDLAGRESGINYYCTHFSNKDPSVAEFNSKYIERFVLEPTSFSALGYDAIMLISNVLKNYPGESIESALPKVRKFNGVTGEFDFKKGRDPAKSLIILKLDRGRVSVEQKFLIGTE